MTDTAGYGVRSGRGPLAGTGRAHDGGVDDEFPCRTERALGQVQVDPDGGVPPAPRPAARTARRGPAAKEGVHEVAEREAGRAETSPAGSGPGERVRPEVVHLALLRVGQHLVRLGDLLEPLLQRRVGVHVGVQLAGQTAIGLLNLVRTSIPAHAEDPVVVVCHRHPYDSARICPTYRATARTAPIAVG